MGDHINHRDRSFQKDHPASHLAQWGVGWAVRMMGEGCGGAVNNNSLLPEQSWDSNSIYHNSYYFHKGLRGKRIQKTHLKKGRN